MTDGFVEHIINGEAIESKSQGMTGRSLLVSLALSLALFIFYVSVFTVLRKRQRSIYEPRTFVVAEHFRTPPTSDGLFSWLLPTLKTSHSSILHTSGVDAYFFLRYIVFVMTLCAAMSVPLLVVLLPLHLTGNRDGVEGLDKLSTLNLSEEQKSRHVAHLMLCLLSTCGSLIFFRAELTRYFHMRAEHILNNSEYPGSASTLLIKGLHASCRTENGIRRFYESLSTSPGNINETLIKHIWFNKDYSKLNRLVQARAKVLEKLETLEVWLIERCLGVGKPPEEQSRCNNNKDATIVGNLWRNYLFEDDLKEMLGAKGGLLTWLKSELSRLNSQIYHLQSEEGSFPMVNSCFIQFNSKLSSFIASRSLGSEVGICQANDLFDRVYPADIIWSNLSSPTWVQYIVAIGATGLNYLFVFGWAAPVAAISMMTQKDVMAEWMPHIHWMVESPRMTQLLSSVLSPLMVSGLTSHVPTVFRFLAQLKGFPSDMRVEMDVQKHLFLFMFFQLFLIVTLTTGLPGLIVKTLLNTSEGAITLASCLPKATTFFICYLVVNCLTTAGNALMQTQQLIISAWYYTTARTPRQIMRNKCRYSTIYWGSVFPLVTNAGTIAIAYALISPVILLSAMAGLACLYVAYKYRIVYCYVPRNVADGDYYPKAIFQLFAGLYCQQVSLLGTLLVSLQLDLATLAALIVVGTIVSQHYLQRMFQDMSTRIPLDFVAEEEKMLSGINSAIPGNSLKNSELFTKHASTVDVAQAPRDFRSISSLAEVPVFSTFSHSERVIRPLTSMPNLRSPRSPPSDETIVSTTESIHSSEIKGTATAALHETWMGLFDALTCEFRNLTVGQQEYVSLHMYEHPDLRLQRPCVWLPRDWKGTAQDQALEMQTVFADLRSSCNGAEIDPSGKITVTQAAPDFDPIEIMKL